MFFFFKQVNENKLSMDCPLLNFRIGQVLSARIIAKPLRSGKRHMWELSLKPSSSAGILFISYQLFVFFSINYLSFFCSCHVSLGNYLYFAPLQYIVVKLIQFSFQSVICTPKFFIIYFTSQSDTKGNFIAWHVAPRKCFYLHLLRQCS